VNCLAHLILDLVTLISVAEKIRSFSLCNFLQPVATSSLLGPNILLSTLLSVQIRYFSFETVHIKLKKEGISTTQFPRCSTLSHSVIF
jgi:hypothetical protein